MVTFEQFAVARHPSLLRSAVVLTGDRDLAQDVVQEVLARAQVRWKRISTSTSPDAYVRRMLLNEYLPWGPQLGGPQRACSRRATGRPGRRPGGINDHAQDVVEADELWNRLATLGRKQRAVLVLRYYEQLDDAAIADLLACTPATVRSNASKALRTLRLGSERARIHVRETP